VLPQRKILYQLGARGSKIVASSVKRTNLNKLYSLKDAPNAEPERWEHAYRRAMEALQRSEERYRTAIENSHDGVLIVREGKILFCNGRMIKMFGYDSADDFLHAKPYFFIHPSDVARIRQINEDRYAGKSVPERYEFKGIRKDGKNLALEASVTRILFQDMPATLVYVRDLTDKKKAEEALKKSEEQYRRIVETTSEGICVLDKGWRITLVNNQIEKMFGYKQVEMIGKDFTIFGSDEESAARRKRREQGIPEQFERKYQRKDGTTLWVHLSATPIVDENSRFVGAFAMLTDITARKCAEEALKESEERYRIVVEQTGQLVYDVDIAGGFVKRSGAISEISGYTPEEFQGDVNFWKNSIHPDDRALAVRSFRRAMRQCSYYDVEYRFRRKDGIYVFIEDRGIFLKDREGKACRMLGTMKNITRRKKLMNELKHGKEELEIKNTTLEEVNTALRVLLRQIEQDRKDQEERFASNVKKLVLPYVENIKKGRLDTRQKSFISIIEANLDQIVSPFLHGLGQFNLNPREVRIASLIKDGKTTKEIADVMGVAPSSIDTHRNIMRRKLGLNNTKTNLQTYLQSIM
jgi:PAS domain S-box-containing protein